MCDSKFHDLEVCSALTVFVMPEGNMYRALVARSNYTFVEHGAMRDGISRIAFDVK